MLMVLALAATGTAQDLNGQMLAGGYLGYSFGMGDQFDEYNHPNFKDEINAGFSLGGQFFYGLAEKLMVGSELMLQSYSRKIDYEDDADPDFNDSELKFSILANALYSLNYTEETALFFIGGIGVYDRNDLGLGFNAGILYRMNIGDNLYVYGMPRVHFLLADPGGQMIQISFGLQYSIGNY